MVQLLVQVTSPPAQAADLLRAFESVRVPALIGRDCAWTHLGTDSGDAGIVTYIEEWTTVQSLEQRIASPEFGVLLRLLEASTETPMLECRFVSEVRGLDLVSAVRSRGNP